MPERSCQWCPLIRHGWSGKSWAPICRFGALVVSATKGIDADSLLTMSRVLRDVIPAEKQVDIAALSGPTFAREVSRQSPSAVVAAADTHAVAEEVQTLFSTPGVSSLYQY